VILHTPFLRPSILFFVSACVLVCSEGVPLGQGLIEMKEPECIPQEIGGLSETSVNCLQKQCLL
jgi:hypothetical protein